MSKKTAIQNFKLKPETKEEFQNLCDEHQTTPSHELRQFVHRKINQLKKQF